MRIRCFDRETTARTGPGGAAIFFLALAATPAGLGSAPTGTAPGSEIIKAAAARLRGRHPAPRTRDTTTQATGIISNGYLKIAGSPARMQVWLLAANSKAHGRASAASRQP